jgi:hypothetical protein
MATQTDSAVQVYTVVCDKVHLLARRPGYRPLACIRLTPAEPVTWGIEWKGAAR